MMEALENSTTNLPRRGFSIATLLLLTAVAAIALAAIETTWLKIDKLDRNRPPTSFWRPPEPSPFERQVQALAGRAVGGAFIGIISGLVIGITRSRRFLGTLLAVLVGAVGGALTASLFTQPENVLLAVVGSVVLLLFGAVVRTFSSHTQ
jgi:LytS/YehU family sensor histidine kinase